LFGVAVDIETSSPPILDIQTTLVFIIAVLTRFSLWEVSASAGGS